MTFVLGMLLLPACPGPAPQGGTDRLVYLLQPGPAAVDELRAAECTWIVLEPERSAAAGGPFSAAEIAQLRAGGRWVLAYLSIGEAEEYRAYWNPAWVDADGAPVPGVAPAWLGPENPDWAGNYKVRYWDAGWQALLFGAASTPLERIIDQGFDGAYLDLVDAYEFWSTPEGGSELSRSAARQAMIELLETLAARARQGRGRPDFLVVPQNAADIIRDDDGGLDPWTARYFAVVNGLGQEDLYYDELNPQPADETAYVLEQLREFVARGKTVLVTDYVLDAVAPASPASRARAAEFRARCEAERFVPCAATSDRALDRVVLP